MLRKLRCCFTHFNQTKPVDKILKCIIESPLLNKEKIITIAVGLLVGILSTGGYFIVKKVWPGQPPAIVIQPQNQNIPNREASVSAATSLVLTLDQPNDRISTPEALIAVSGKTAPAATVLVFANADEKIASADATGNFQTKIKLEDGENEISVTAVANGVEPVVARRSVTLEVSQ